MAERTSAVPATTTAAYSPSELMVVAAARELKDGERVLVGHGIPNLAVDLAKSLYAPNLVCLFEIGVIDTQPGGEPGVGSADPRLWRGAVSFRGTLEVMGTLLQRGRVDVGFLGALEVDRYGNINSTEVLTPEGRPRRFGGSGGGNDIASHARRVIIVCRHGRQKLVERVRFLTSPGHIGPEGRLLPGGGPHRLVTDKAVLAFDGRGELSVVSIHPGVTKQELVEETGCELSFPAELPVTPPPKEADLRLIREVLDPGRQFTDAP